MRSWLMLFLLVLMSGAIVRAQDDTVLEIDPLNALVLTEEGRFMDAIAIYDALLAEDNPSDELVWLQIRASLLALVGRESDALTDIESAITLNGADDETSQLARELRLERARLLLLTGDTDTAGDVLEGLHDAMSENARYLSVRGLWLFATDVLDSADASFQRALQIASGDSVVYERYGFFFAQTGRSIQAIPQYDQAIRLDENNVEAWNGRAVAYLQSAQYDEAVADFLQAMERAPQWATPRINTAILYRTQGDNDTALTYFAEAISIDPAYAEAYLARAFTYIEQGNNAPDDAGALPLYDLALADLVEFVNLTPSAQEVPLEVRALILQLESLLGMTP
jgi:tetratricopeptide (TPR) repeat protein